MPRRLIKGNFTWDYKAKKYFALSEWMNSGIYIPMKHDVDLMDRWFEKSESTE